MASYYTPTCIVIVLISWHPSTAATTTTESSFAIRLENGLYNYSGRVGVYHDSQWGGVCEVGWSWNESNVACRMLGYTNGTITSYYDDTMDSTVYEWFGNDTGPGVIWMSGVQCDGTETSLVDCPFDGWGVGSCSRPAYVVCYNEDDSPMDVRLAIGRSDGYGSVEIYYNSIWGGLTYLSFRDNEAKVVCRMLGYSQGVSYGWSDISYTTIPKWRSRRCTGNETSLADCPVISDLFDDNLGSGAALCYGETQATSSTTESFFAIRLQNGLYNHSGRVEVYHDGQWGGVCERDWSWNDANVACRMLGYTNGTITSYYDDTMDSTVYEWFGNDTDPGIIWMSGVQCDGTETSLVDCPFDGWGVGSCSSPAYVVCYNEDDSPMDVRLVIGRSDGYGSVEVYYNSIWGGLTYLRFWHNEAKVVCRMLGYSHGVSYGASDIPFTTIPLWRSRSCTGNETSLADCPFVMYHHGNRHTLSEGLGCGAALCYDDPQGTMHA